MSPSPLLKFVLLSLALLCVAAVSVPLIRPPIIGGGGLVGGWAPGSPYSLPSRIDQFVRRQKPELLRARITSVSTQVVAGTNYKIVYQVLGSPIRSFEAVVFEQPWTRTIRLTSYRILPF